MTNHLNNRRDVLLAIKEYFTTRWRFGDRDSDSRGDSAEVPAEPLEDSLAAQEEASEQQGEVGQAL